RAMKIRVRVAGPAADYAVRVERDLLARVGALVRPHAPGGRVLLVTDRTVGRLYGARVERSLKRAGLDVSRTTIPAGERAKSFAMARSLCERWAKEGAGATPSSWRWGAASCRTPRDSPPPSSDAESRGSPSRRRSSRRPTRRSEGRWA